MAREPKLPTYREQLRKEKFESWLKSRGADVLETGSPWEVLRVVVRSETLVLYRNKSDRLTWPPQLAEVWAAHMKSEPIELGPAPRPRRLNAKRRSRVCDTLLQRDGGNCFFCLEPLVDDITLEHLIAKINGGTNNLANLALAHLQCNSDADCLSVMEKIAIREKALVAKLKAGAQKAAVPTPAMEKTDERTTDSA